MKDDEQDSEDIKTTSNEFLRLKGGGGGGQCHQSLSICWSIWSVDSSYMILFHKMKIIKQSFGLEALTKDSILSCAASPKKPRPTDRVFPGREFWSLRACRSCISEVNSYFFSMIKTHMLLYSYSGLTQHLDSLIISFFQCAALPPSIELQTIAQRLQKWSHWHNWTWCWWPRSKICLVELNSLDTMVSQVKEVEHMK